MICARHAIDGKMTESSARNPERSVSKLLVIVGSTRPNLAADSVLPWVARTAEAHGEFEVEVADLRDWPLPLFGEHFGTVGDIADPTYSEPLVKAWNNKVKSADAFLVITPEYNHSIPGVLKNAIDTVWLSFGFRNKPVAAVGYASGQSGAIRAIEHLAHIVIEAEAVPLRNTVIIPSVGTAFGEDGEPANPITAAALGILLDDLAWWSAALGRARSEGELVPGNFRLRAAMQAAAARA
jgi:NAD(P)H-dependent FMN reductase